MRSLQPLTASITALLAIGAGNAASQTEPAELVSITLSGEPLGEIMQRLTADYGYSFGYPPFAHERRGQHMYIEPSDAPSAMQRMAAAYGLCSRILIGMEHAPKFVLLRDCEGDNPQVVPEPRQVLDTGRTDGVFLGVIIRDAGTETMSESGRRGVFVGAFTDERSVAEQAGLRVGDVIVAYNGTAVTNSLHLVDLLQDSRPGDEVALIIERDGRPQIMIARFPTAAR